nr:helix-turn-helix domain-containing protein [Fredinandcohnia onubensis]
MSTSVKRYSKTRRKLYIALEEVDHNWCIDEVKIFEKMWNAGVSLEDISTYFKRHPVEIVLLIIDRADQGRIKPRPEGLGGEYESIRLLNSKKNK